MPTQRFPSNSIHRPLQGRDTGTRWQTPVPIAGPKCSLAGGPGAWCPLSPITPLEIHNGSVQAILDHSCSVPPVPSCSPRLSNLTSIKQSNSTIITNGHNTTNHQNVGHSEEHTNTSSQCPGLWGVSTFSPAYDPTYTSQHAHCLEEPLLPVPDGTNPKSHTTLEEARIMSAGIPEGSASKTVRPKLPWHTPKSLMGRNQKYKRMFLDEGYSSLSNSFSSTSSLSEEDLCWQECRKSTWDNTKIAPIKKGDWKIANKLNVMPVKYNRRGNPFWVSLVLMRLKN